MMVEVKHEIGDTVYLKTDPEQRERLIVSFVVLPGGLVQYNVAMGEDESSHYDFELTINITVK